MGTRRSFGGWLMAAAFVVACGGTTSNRLFVNGRGSDAGATCATGHERCDCYGNDTCNAGLTCASGLCVRQPGTTNGPDASAGGARGSGAASQTMGGAGDRAAGGANAGTGGAHIEAGGAQASGGRRATGGTTSGDGGPPPGGDASSAGTKGDGGAPASGGLPGSGGACGSGLKFCGGVCSPPSPKIGCGLTGCGSCALVSPPNGYVTCANNQCAIECLSGFMKVDSLCISGPPPGSGGSGGSTGTCNLPSCPSCNVVEGPACCTSDGKCGCPAIPFVASSCK